jgi:hypothetical protein
VKKFTLKKPLEELHARLQNEVERKRFLENKA